MRPKKILLATALTENSDAAHGWVEAIAGGDDVEVVLLHVDEWATVGFHDSSDLIDYYARVKQFRDRFLDEEARRLRARGLRVTTRTAEGTAAWHVLDLAGEIGADLVVLTRSPVDDARKLLLGSTARRVCRHAGVPILAVAPVPRPGRVAPRRILTTTDFSPDSARGMREVEALSRRFDAKVMALHVHRAPLMFHPAPIDLPLLPAGLRSQALESAHTRLVEHLAELKLRFEPLVRSGDVAHTIATTAVETGADMIAIPSHGHGVARAIFGSTTEAVLTRAMVPVLVFPRQWVKERQGA